jgi:2-dehydro-3-deoxy-L-rhamnonate dehydrogenase (NAD+)
MRRFENQVAVITGGAQGLGLAIARRLAGEGARLALLDANAAQVEESAAGLAGTGPAGSEPLPLSVDVTDEIAVAAAMARVLERFGRIDVLVTAAGIVGPSDRKAHEVRTADFDRVLGVNLRGMFFCIRAVLPTMLKADYGRIVNIASISGKDGNEGMMPYTASKAAVIGMTMVIGREYAHTGITCNAIAPALIATAMTLQGLSPEHYQSLTARIPMHRTGTPEEVAAVAAFVASRECSFTTGFTFDASGGRAVY